MMQPQMASDASQVHPIDIQLDGSFAGFQVIAAGFGLWGIFTTAVHAFEALAPGRGEPFSILPGLTTTFRTGIHLSILLPQQFSHS